MTRDEIIETFRADNPEVTVRVASDTVLRNWLLSGDKEFCAITKCIVADFTFSSVASSSVYNTRYDLTVEEPKFYAIDDSPGGGVSFDDEPLIKTTVSELDRDTGGDWRTRSAGVPEKYYSRGKWLYFDYPVLTADEEIRVYAALISDDFNNDDIMPFNQLTYLEPFHTSLSLYLDWRVKQKIGKREDSKKARDGFIDYCNFAKRQIGGMKFGPIHYEPKSNYRG